MTYIEPVQVGRQDNRKQTPARHSGFGLSVHAMLVI
jgi:hypothetical protein